MSRGKDAARRQAEQELARRRNSASNRALRRRAQQGKGAHAAPVQGADAGASSGPAVAPEVQVERTPTSELRTPEWLTEPGDAALPAWALDDHEPYTPEVAAPVQPEATPQLEPDEDAEADPEPEVEAVAEADAETEAEPDRNDDAAAAVGAGAAAGATAGAAVAATSAIADEDVAPAEQTVQMEPIDAGDTQVMPPVPATPAAPAISATPAPAAPAVATPVAAAPASAAPPAASAVSHDPDAAAPAPPKKRRRGVAVVLLVIVALAILYVGAQALVSGTVPRETQTLGVSIGGMSTAEATGAVDDRATEAATADLVLEADDQTYVTTAQAAGLSVDADATVAQVTGFTMRPERLWAHATGGGSIEPITAVDQPGLDSTIHEAATTLDGAAVDASVSLADDAIEVVPGRSAITIDQESSATLVAAAWPDSQTVVLVADIEDPAVTDADAQAFADSLSNQVLAGPVTLTGEDAEATVDADTLAAYATVVTGPGGLDLEIDGEGLATQLVEDNPDLKTDGENATVSFDDNQDIVVDPGSPGITIDGAALGQVVKDAANAPLRTGELPYTAADAEITAEDLGIDDFQEVVASFDTPLTAERIRTQNLRTAAADVQGTIVQPGDLFDLTEVLSPINREEGYQEAHVIVNGILTNGMGGGLSQMATTAYNAGYFAGYEILDHRPHSVWFTRYPAGRESTIYTGSINVVFENTTPYAAIFNSYVAGGRLHVDIWSTPHFTVETSASPKTNVKQPGVDEVRAANCEAKGPGQPGFTITNTRTVLLDGDVVEETSDTWTYQPDDAIKCVSDEDDEDDDS